MKSKSTSLITALMIAGCAYAPPKQNPAPVAVADYGEYPANYKAIVLEYLKENPPKDGIETSSIFFMNTPDRYMDRSYVSSDTAYGYRVCIQGRTESITKKSNQLHFFLINNNHVVKHSSSTGLATFFDRQCSFGPQQSGTATPAPIAAATAPAAPAAVAPAPAPSPVPAPASSGATPTAQAGQHLKYIVCEVGDREVLLTLDQDKNQLTREIEGEPAGIFSIESISETSIVATDSQGRLYLSRVSGKMIYRKGDQKIVGDCGSSEGTKY